MKNYEYAFYKGDQLLFIGTLEECCEELGLKPNSIRHYSSKNAFERLESKYQRGFNNAKVAVRLDMDELDSEMEEADNICSSKKLWKKLSQSI